jgi:hypothetical protein
MNFRKQICITLALLLLVSNTGFVFNVHYCGDEISSISSISSISFKTYLSSNEIEKNCCGEIEKKSNCCDNKVVHFQKKSETSLVHEFFQMAYIQMSNNDWNPNVTITISNFKKNSIPTYFCDANAPPYFKLYSQYIFYA